MRKKIGGILLAIAFLFVVFPALAEVATSVKIGGTPYITLSNTNPYAVLDENDKPVLGGDESNLAMSAGFKFSGIANGFVASFILISYLCLYLCLLCDKKYGLSS